MSNNQGSNSQDLTQQPKPQPAQQQKPRRAKNTAKEPNHSGPSGTVSIVTEMLPVSNSLYRSWERDTTNAEEANLIGAAVKPYLGSPGPDVQRKNALSLKAASKARSFHAEPLSREPAFSKESRSLAMLT